MTENTMTSKILLLDIEMAPNVAHVWGIWDQNIGLNQLRESSYVMCYAAKWLGDKKMIFDLVNEMHKFLMQETQKIVEKTGMTEDQLSRFSENPDNFSSSQWKALELVKNELDQTAKELTTIIRGGKKEVTKKTTSLTRNKPSRKDRWLKS